MVAAGLSGPARASVGAVRDFVLGVTLLNGRGDLLRFGGQVIKNVAGYDVSRLMVGALGTSVGFAIFQSGSVLIGNGLGFMTGEWKEASSESKRWLAGGLTVLIAGIVVVSIGNAIQ